MKRRWTAICSLISMRDATWGGGRRGTSDSVGLRGAGRADPLYVAAIHFYQDVGSGAHGVGSERIGTTMLPISMPGADA